MGYLFCFLWFNDLALLSRMDQGTKAKKYADVLTASL